MSNIKELWQGFKFYERVFRILGILFGCIAVVFGILAILQIFDVINANFHFLPWGLIFLGGENLCNTAYTWKKSKGAAIVALCCGVFVIVCAIIGIIKL